jgi:hypothetical protein
MVLPPEGVERVSARGFNPGDPVPRRRALKGRQIKRRHNTGQTSTHLSPLQGEAFVWMVPGLKPWAKSYSPFGQNHSKAALT